MKLADNRNNKQFLIPWKIQSIEDSGDFVKIYVSGSCVRDEIKKTLIANARKEIREKTKCGYLPRSIANKVKCYLFVSFDGEGYINGVSIGADIILNPKWADAIGITARNYIKMIRDYWSENQYRDNNLSLMAGCNSEIETEYNDINEMLQMERFLTEVLA